MLKRLVEIVLVLVLHSHLYVAHAQGINPASHSEALSRAAAEFGVKLSQKSYAVNRFGSRVYEGAIIERFEQTPVTAYGDGIDFAVVRYSSATVKDGYYKAHLVPLTKITKLGRTKVSVKLVDSAGKVAHVNNSVAHVFSLELPKQAKSLGATLEFASSAWTKRNSMSIKTLQDVDVLGTVCCSNGMCGTCIGKACPQN